MVHERARPSPILTLFATTLLAGALYGLLSYVDIHEDDSLPFLRLQQDGNPNSERIHRLLSAVDDIARRENCQIVYVLGVEGAGHNGFTPVLRKLIERQVDPRTDARYVYHAPQDPLVQKAVFGHRARDRAVGDPELVTELLRSICPSDGARHVLLLDTSFPSKGTNGSYYRVGRQKEWTDMAMTEIAESETALNHPLNLREFYDAYSPHADVRFVALSQPFMVTIADRSRLDGGPEQHAAVVSGYLLLLRQFLTWLSRAAGGKTWTLVCMEELSEEFHRGDMAQVISSRTTIVRDLARFLGWPVYRCDDCFLDHGEEKIRSPTRKLEVQGVSDGKPHTKELMNMKKEVLKGIWPPPNPPHKHQRQCSR
ncbi:hypothetical protein ACHAWF_006128 [Thalassiosira exigua]